MSVQRLTLLSTLILACIMGWSFLVLSTPPLTAKTSITYDHFVHLPLIMNDYDPAWSWSQLLTPTLAPSPANVVMTIDNAGRVHILWDTNSYAQQFIFHTYLTAQGWTTPTAILPTLGTSYVMYPPVLGNDGRFHLLWRNHLSSNGQQYNRLLYAVFDSMKWEPEQEIYRASGIYGLDGMVQLDPAGKPHATFSTNLLFTTDIYHSVLEVGGWSAPVEVSLPAYYIGYQTVWPDQQGGVRAYRDDNGDMRYFNWRNNQFLTYDQHAIGGLGNHSSQLDGQNNLHTFWTSQVPTPGGSVMGLYYRCLASNLSWGPQQILSGQSAASSALRASDGVSNAALAWSETNIPARLGIWNGCRQTDLKSVPLPAGSWTLKALALGSSPKKVCLLASRGGYPATYNVICADIKR